MSTNTKVTHQKSKHVFQIQADQTELGLFFASFKPIECILGFHAFPWMALINQGNSMRFRAKNHDIHAWTRM